MERKKCEKAICDHLAVDGEGEDWCRDAKLPLYKVKWCGVTEEEKCPSIKAD